MNTTEQKFDLEYFISKFEAIPEDQWTTNKFRSIDGCQKCAYGHLGMTDHCEFEDCPEAMAIDEITGLGDPLSRVNDNSWDRYSEFGSTPKQRVVNYLKSLR